MTTIGHGSTARIAAARIDGTVDIYDSVTGAVRLSLRPLHPIQAMTGSPDGSTLICTHRENPSITLWDIQTGGFVHTFTLELEVKDTAISLNGRYLACGLSDGTVNVWEVANRTGGPAFRSGSPITCLCWLAPEERLMVATGESVHIRDIATGGVLIHGFNMNSSVCGVVYSQKFNQLAVVTSSGPYSFIIIIDARTGTSPVSIRLQERLTCFAFSRAAKVLVCGLETHGLVLVDVLRCGLTYFDLPTTIKSVSTLSNGIVVTNAAGIGIQLLSLGEGYAPSQELIPPAPILRPLDKNRIIAIIPANHGRVILLEMGTMLQVLAIPVQEHLPVPTDRTDVLCASLEKGIAVRCSVGGGKWYLQLWVFLSRKPRWTAQTEELPSAGDISPTYDWLVTFHDGCSQSSARIWDVCDGRLLARLDIGLSPRPLDITFDSEDTFHIYHDTCRTTYVVVTSIQSGTPTHSINYLEKTTLDDRELQREYCVDDGREWVVSGSRRICWIPPGYIGSDQVSHCWAGSSLIMPGQDGILRKLTFRTS